MRSLCTIIHHCCNVSLVKIRLILFKSSCYQAQKVVFRACFIPSWPHADARTHVSTEEQNKNSVPQRHGRRHKKCKTNEKLMMWMVRSGLNALLRHIPRSRQICSSFLHSYINAYLYTSYVHSLKVLMIGFHLNPYPGKGVKMTPQCGFCRKLHNKPWNETALLWHCYRPLGLSEATE